MSGFLATFLRELRAYFYSPLAYVILAAFLFVNGIFFALLVGYLTNSPSPPGSPLEFFFGGFTFWLFLAFLGAVLPMRLLSEERRSGTIELLMTAAVSEAEVVVGKYLAALVFFVFLWLPTVGYAIIIDQYGDLDWGPVASAYLGVFGIGGLFVAAGLLASALSRNQIVAAMLGFALVLVFFFVAFLEFLVTDPLLRDVVNHTNLLAHMEDFARGIVDTRPLVYYASTTVVLLLLSIRTLEARKWR